MSVPPFDLNGAIAHLTNSLTAEKRNEKINEQTLKSIESYIDDNIRPGINRDVSTRNYIYINVMSMIATIDPKAGGYIYRGIRYSTKDQACNAVELDLRSRL